MAVLKMIYYIYNNLTFDDSNLNLDKNLRLDISKTIKHAENLIDQGCHGVAMFGSTGQAQLISISEKIITQIKKEINLCTVFNKI